MGSFLKRLALTRLQLLVLVLVLGVGLLPKNSMAEDEECRANADKTCDPTTDSPIKPVKCWEQRCEGSFNCLKKASEPDATIKYCPGGYCYLAIGLYNYTNGEEIIVVRGCDPHKVNCLKQEPGHCGKLNLVGDEKTDKLAILSSDFTKCLLQQMPDGAYSTAHEDRGLGSGTLEACLCDKDLCNGGSPILSRSTGVKHLGYNVVLVGVLLVAIFLLQTMSMS